METTFKPIRILLEKDKEAIFALLEFVGNAIQENPVLKNVYYEDLVRVADVIGIDKERFQEITGETYMPIYDPWDDVLDD